MSQLAVSALAAESVSDRPTLAVYAAQGFESNLPEVPKALFSGELAFDPTYLVAVSLGTLVPTPPLWQQAFDRIGLPGTRLGFEAVVARHHGLQEHVELSGAFVLCFAGSAFGPVRVRPMFGIGLSYAAGRPNYEDPPVDGDPNQRYRLQLFNVYELAWSRSGASNGWELVTRIHHRSGAYGVIAPRGVGSNFLGVGVRHAV